MIPKVKTWTVKFFDDTLNPIAQCEVDTINKRFARWIANEQCGYPAIRSSRITVSLKRDKKGAQNVN